MVTGVQTCALPISTQKDPKALAQSSFDIACAYIACGLDTSKVKLFRQSAVPQVHELTWVLNTVTPMPMLELAHAYKSKIDYIQTHDVVSEVSSADLLDMDNFLNKKTNHEVNVGLFDYPILMAADILIYGGELVPVGKDQEQHIEITREVAGKFNRAFKPNFFKMPTAHISKDVAIVPGDRKSVV